MWKEVLIQEVGCLSVIWEDGPHPKATQLSLSLCVCDIPELDQNCSRDLQERLQHRPGLAATERFTGWWGVLAMIGPQGVTWVDGIGQQATAV